jgi:hypothetical protein
MSDDPSTSTWAKFVLGLAALALLPALWSLGSALISAVGSGEVLVISLGRTSTSRTMVPWQQGWARFAGPLLLTVSLALWVVAEKRSTQWWLSALLAAMALSLLAFSMWFTSLRSTLGFLGFAAFIAATFAANRYFGRKGAYAVILVAAVAFVWRLSNAA